MANTDITPITPSNPTDGRSVPFTNTPPDWKANGVEPTTELKKKGFVAGYKPPAAYFNWFWKKTSDCISELQDKANDSYDKLKKYTDDSITTQKSYTDEMYNKTAGRNQYDSSGNKQGEVFNNSENNSATGKFSHAEGSGNDASGVCSHAEGSMNIASGKYSHAEGSMNTASGEYSHAEGYSTIASGKYSRAEGNDTTAAGQCSSAGGAYTNAGNYQMTIGKYNTEYAGATEVNDTTGTAFIVGIGTGSARRNGFRVTNAGQCMGVTYFSASGADYAEFFEWKDGNTNNVDRRGLFVTLDGDKIRLANAKDTYILGAVSATPNVIGDSQSEEWHARFKKDIFGEIITETSKGVTQPVLNPNYNPDKEYIPRSERKEWATVGLLGKLIVVDDGSCKVNGYCKVSNNGVATTADTGYRVMSRIDNTHIQILFR